MNKLISISNTSIIILFLITIVSCGSDKSNTKNDNANSSITNGLAAQCACTASYMPVCGVKDNTYVTYDNICIADCYKVTQTVQGNCICTNKPVCGDDNQTYTECDAQTAIRNGYIKKITKFADCNSATY